MCGSSLYRMRAKDLADQGFDKELLSARVERYSDKPISDGIAIDRAGNICLGDLAENTVCMITPAETTNASRNRPICLRWNRYVPGPKAGCVPSPIDYIYRRSWMVAKRC